MHRTGATVTPRPKGTATSRSTPGRRPLARRAGPSPWHAVLAAILTAVAVYAHTLSYPFIWDDETMVVQNQQIESLRNTPAIFTSHTYAGAESKLGVPVTQYYRPLWVFTLAIDHALWNERAAGYHLTNVVLHAVAAGLVAWIVFQLLGHATLALCAGVWFAGYPIHAEAVSWISARNDLMLAVFLLVSFSSYVNLRRRVSGAAVAGCVGGFLLALLSKETAAVFPALVLLSEWTLPPPAEHGEGKRFRARRWFAPVALGVIALAFWSLRKRLVMDIPITEDLTTRIATAPGLVLDSLRLLLFPFGLRVFHLTDPVSSFASIRFLVPAAVCVAVAALFPRLRRLDSNVALGVGWMFVALLPTCGIAGLPKPFPLSERYLYLPSIGWAMAAASLFARLLGDRAAETHPSRKPRVSRRVAFAAAALLAAVFGVLAVVRSQPWRDQLAFMTRMTREAPREARGHDALGLLYRQQGRWANAAQMFTTAARLEPGDPRYPFHLGDAYEHLGRLDSAEKAFEDAIAKGIQYPEARNELGWIYEQRGNLQAAADQYRAAAAMDPGYAEAAAALAKVLARMGRWPEAELAFKEAIRIQPDDPGHHQDLGAFYTATGRATDAVAEFREALRLDPSLPQADFGLAGALLVAGQSAEAEPWARAGIARGGDGAKARWLLGRILAARGAREAALAELRAALRMAADTDTELKLGIQRDIVRAENPR